jgi:hypothetical protein
MAMAANLARIIEQLKLERDILRDGGYGRSAAAPWKATTLFRDSVTCLNFGEPVKKRPCKECLLWEWVPEGHRGEDIPCHFIPLNESGDTITSLERQGDREKAEHALLGWLERTIYGLEERARRGEPGPAEA